MVHFEDSYKLGKKEELKVLPIINNYFKRDIKMYPERYAKYDFFDDKYQYELKTRTNTMNKYDTTMITSNKINNDTQSKILLFNYIDCIAYIEYDKDLFNTFEKKMFSRAQLKNDEKEHTYIPVDKLKVIHCYKKEYEIDPINLTN
jgi:hypothetical protein